MAANGTRGTVVVDCRRSGSLLPTGQMALPPALIDLCSVDVPASADYIRDTIKRGLLP